MEGQFEGAVDGKPVRGTMAVVVMSCPIRPNSAGMSPQRLAWADSDGDGRTLLTVTGMHDPAGLTSRRGPS
jgi:hypothetical protein